MGAGAWSSAEYSTKVCSMGFTTTDDIVSCDAAQSFSAHGLNSMLDPHNVVRECRDTEEHPETIPIMLCVDCTGSMGKSLKNCFAKLDETITRLLRNFKDIEICVAGVGDFVYDSAPFQMSQYESDSRILDNLLLIWQERGGGANKWESYSAAWYAGLYHTDLDCWKRGKKGIIITLGDESANPVIYKDRANDVFGDDLQDDVDTEKLLAAASEKFDIYHIAITDEECSYKYHKDLIEQTWRPLLGQRLLEGKSEELPELIEQIVKDSCNGSYDTGLAFNADGEISW